LTLVAIEGALFGVDDHYDQRVGNLSSIQFDELNVG
jgi:hypothetical protein